MEDSKRVFTEHELLDLCLAHFVSTSVNRQHNNRTHWSEYIMEDMFHIEEKYDQLSYAEQMEFDRLLDEGTYKNWRAFVDLNIDLERPGAFSGEASDALYGLMKDTASMLHEFIVGGAT